MKSKTLLIFCCISSLFFNTGFASEEVEESPTAVQVLPNTFKGSFNKLHVTGPIDVVLKESSQSQVEVHCLPEQREKLVVEIKGNTAKVFYDDRFLSNLTTLKNKKIQIIVSSSLLTEMILKGSGELISEEALYLESLHLSKNGSGSITLNLGVKNLKLELRGSCQASIKGSAKKMKLTCFDSSRYSGRDFITESSEVSLKDTSKIIIHSSKNLKVHISGNAQLRYLGDPKLMITKVQGPSSVLPL